MADFVLQGQRMPSDVLARTLDQNGVRINRSLDHLSSLSGVPIFLVTTPEGFNQDALKALPGVAVVEGEYFHPFYTSPGLPPFRLPANPLPFLRPRDVVASLIQLLPAPAFKALSSQNWVESLTQVAIPEAGALESFDVKTYPFGAPGLHLGSVVDTGDPRSTGDLESILNTIRAPQAQRFNQGQGAIIAVVDSGIDPSKVPAANRLGGWSDQGQDPWQDDEGHGSMVAGIALAVAPQAMIVSVKPGTGRGGGMSSMGTLSSLDYLAGLAQQLRRPIISNHSWGIFGVKNLILPCSVFVTRTVRLLDEQGLVMTTWAAGNNGDQAGPGAISGYCMNTSKWSASAGALDRNLRPQPYTSLGGQCFPWQPTVSAPTYGVMPWGAGYMDFGEQGGATSACAPQVAGTLAIMMTRYPGRPFRNYRAALRAGANNGILGLPGVPWNPATGAGLLQVDRAVEAVPWAQLHPSWLLEARTPTSIPLLGQESETDLMKG